MSLCKAATVLQECRIITDKAKKRPLRMNRRLWVQVKPIVGRLCSTYCRSTANHVGLTLFEKKKDNRERNTYNTQSIVDNRPYAFTQDQWLNSEIQGGYQTM